MPFKSALRTTLLVVSLAESLCRFAVRRVWTRLFHQRDLTRGERALWLHGCCRRIRARLRLGLATNAALPTQGLIVSNHLSHLDILLFGSLGPVIFVAKEEVRAWPLLGKLAECGGTVFVDRTNPTQAVTAAQQIETCLREGIAVLLFPEGTSSDGMSVLPFRSPLFEPAMRANVTVTAAAIAYAASGIKESTLAYYGEKVFFPHLYATLGSENLRACIHFSESATYSSRKEAAVATHQQVCLLRDQVRTGEHATE